MRAVVVVAVAALVVAAVPGAAQEGPSQSPAWVPADGGITLVAADGKVYLGGDFSRLAPPFGAFAVYRQGQKKPDASVVRFRDGGQVSAIVGDGAGGWFVGGSFKSFAGVGCPNLVHVLANGRVAASSPCSVRRRAPCAPSGWCPPFNEISVLVRQGRVLYAVESLYDNGLNSRLWRFETRTGRPLRWHVKLGASRTIYPPNVWAMAATSRLVFLGGGFASVQGRAAKRLAAVDARTGKFVWGAHVNDGRVKNLFVSGGRVFAFGGFSSVNRQKRPGFAALDAHTGRLLDWHPQFRVSRVLDAVASPRILYLSVASGDRPYKASTLIAVAPDSGATLWTRAGDLSPVGLFGRDLLVRSGESLVALDAATGHSRVGRSRFAIDPEQVASVAVSGRRIAIGGRFFTTERGVPRRGLAALDASSGEPTAWRADIGSSNLPDEIRAMAVTGDRLYVAGFFSRGGNQRNGGLAAVDLQTGRTHEWKPPASCGCDAITAATNAVYVVRPLVAHRERKIAAFDSSTGALLSWNPAPDDRVEAVAASGSTVYLAGFFKRIRDADRPYLAAVDAVSGAPSAWRPQPDKIVQALALQGTTLYLGGNFTRIGTTERRALAAFDTTTGQLLPWNPGVYLAEERVHSLYAAGSIVYVDGKPVDATTGQPKKWPQAPLCASAFATTDKLVYVATCSRDARDWGGLVAIAPPP